MKFQNGAMSLAEGQYQFKTDVNLVFGGQRVERAQVLRTTINSLQVWKTRNPNVGLSPFKDKSVSTPKDVSVIDGELWVFGIDASLAQDIVAAVKIASRYYDVSPSVLLNDIYTKNLNAESENNMTAQMLIRANKDLYTGICKALIDAAKQLGISKQLNLYVFSKSNNPKIPQEELLDSLKSGGAKTALTDEYRPKVMVGNNAGTDSVVQITNFHLATL